MSGRESVCGLLVFLCAIAAPPSDFGQTQGPTQDTPAKQSSALLARIAGEYSQYTLTHNFFERFRSGAPLNELPDLSEERAKADGAFAAHILVELEKVKSADLTHEEQITLKILRWQAGLDRGFEKYYWVEINATAYSSVVPVLQRIMDDQQFRAAGDLDHYLSLLDRYPAFVARTRKLLQAQARRGIVLPKDGIPGAKALLSPYLEEPDKSPLFVAQDRLAAIDPALAAPFQEKVKQIIQARINPEFEALIAYISGAYASHAPSEVGLWQYPMGKEYYRFLVRAYTTLDLTPEKLHQIGREDVERLEAEMAGLRHKIGYTGSREEFHQFLQTDPQFIARTPEEVRERLLEYVHRVEPQVGSYFLHVPKAGYDVKRLDPALEGAMTFGYYAEPSPGQPAGIYFFNGSRLNQRSMFKAGPLILHELIPGHHFQLNLTAENHALAEIRRHTILPAYSEGWADYSSRLGEEMGAYRDDYDRYGLLAQEMHQSVRLVVDTGMHAMHWSRAQAKEFMRQHELESETQIESESLRYAMGTPAQALAYRIGSHEMLELRNKAANALGSSFNLKEFHGWILDSGPMPLEVLAWHVDWCIEQARKKRLQVGRSARRRDLFAVMENPVWLIRGTRIVPLMFSGAVSSASRKSCRSPAKANQRSASEWHSAGAIGTVSSKRSCHEPCYPA
jgi:uncharacterized protein (DUF885 family)